MLTKKTQTNMLSGPITSCLIRLTIPIMIMNVMQNLFNTIDLTVLGKLVNDSAVGSVGACGYLITLCTSLLIGVSVGANVVVAKHIGAKNTEQAEKSMGTAVLFSIVGGIVLAVVGFIFAQTFLTWMNCPETLLKGAVTYLRIYFIGIPIIMLYNFCAALLRAKGDTKRPMYFLLLGGAVKVLANIFFVTVFNMTVEGVAIATILSNGIAGGLCLYCLIKSEGSVRFRVQYLRFYFSELKQILFVGVPAGLEQAMYSIANVIISATVNSFGEAATTGISIANQFDGIMFQICVAPSLALIPYVSQNIGAKNIKRAKQAILRTMFITVGFGATLGALSAIFSGELSSLMSTSPEVIMYSKQKMMLISSTYFLCGIDRSMSGTMRGLGRPLIPTWSTLVWMCLFRFVWIYAIFPFCPQSLTFLYLVWPVGWVLSSITQLIFFFPTTRKLQKQIQAT